MLAFARPNDTISRLFAKAYGDRSTQLAKSLGVLAQSLPSGKRSRLTNSSLGKSKRGFVHPKN
jgi:hypothetical protein